MHLAAACQCPTVGIFGLSSVVQWKPWQVPSRVLSALHEMDEWPATMAAENNPILHVTAALAEATAREIIREPQRVGGTEKESPIPASEASR
jgi:ADP-heptose:LPS heptosyltransferase